MKKTSLLAAAALVASAFPFLPVAQAQVPTAARATEAVVLTGAQIPAWSRLAAQGAAMPYPNGAFIGERDAHAGTLVVPPDARTGTPVDDIAAYSYVDGTWTEVPVQVDEKFPYFLANPNSDFGVYSGTDEELTYEWDVESWKKTAGECSAEYAPGDGPKEDPVATLDDDDEIAFMASDAGGQAPLEAQGPAGTTDQRHEVRLVDPLDPTAERFVYLFVKEGGSSFTAENGYVTYDRDDNADEYIDQNRFARTDPELVGSSNGGYGPNLSGTVCGDNLRTPEVETSYQSSDRFPRDGVTVTTDAYKWRASGRWMVREMHIAKPGQPGVYGPDLIDRWKGRAFQQSPDSSISVVGFEDEQVNWEGNSALLGELTGPIRAIRETWGADSGTNVTKTETFYRNAISYRYRVRVHPIPPDGLYTSWDYNQGVATTYYNELKSEGVAVDGRNDDVGHVDEGPTGPAFFDVNDPTFNKPLSFLNWEQVSGAGDAGSLVYMFEMKNAQSLENPLVVPYYRDDACLDDGTGDNPSARAYPGESYQWMRDRAAEGDPVAREYVGWDDPDDANDVPGRPCFTDAPEGYEGNYRQGCFACHGIHYFVTNDTDNAFGPKPTTEIDGVQWQWAAPTEEPTNVGDLYANTVKVPLVPVAALQTNVPGDEEPTGPAPTSLTITGDTAGQTTDTATLAAALTDATGPVAGKEITFALDGTTVGSAVTDETGVASLDVGLTGAARDAVQSAVFAGDDDFATSGATAPFTVAQEDSSITLSLTKSKRDHSGTATLTETDSATALAGEVVRFIVNGTEVGTATTDSEGTASLVLGKLKDGAVVTAVFDPTSTYLGSSAQQSVAR